MISDKKANEYVNAVEGLGCLLITNTGITVTSGGIISQLLTLLPSIQPVECVTKNNMEYREHCLPGAVNIQLTFCFLLWWEFGLVEPSKVWISTACKSYIISWAQTRRCGQYTHSSETQKGCGEPSLFHFHPQEAASSSRQRWAIFL